MDSIEKNMLLIKSNDSGCQVQAGTCEPDNLSYVIRWIDEGRDETEA